jgi:transcriptional regulator with XRE-family HTH domain/tetratricopeptide (TPR) repeat protein
MAGEGLGEQLAELRKRRGWTVRETAARLGYSSHAHLSDYERGTRLPSARTLDELARVLGGDPAELRRLRTAARPKRTVVTTRRAIKLAPRNRRFTGRRHLLGTIASTLAREGTVVLSGLGGVGKTEAALEFAHTGDYAIVWWVSARGGVDAGLEALGTALDAPIHLRDAEDASALWSAVDGAGPALVVIDDAEVEADVSNWTDVPRRSHIIVTTRSRGWPGPTVIAVEPFDDEDGLAHLTQRFPHDDVAEALALVEDLGGLPLAIEQAAAYVEQTDLSLGAYRDLLRRRRELLGRGAPAGYGASVATTWSLNLIALAENRAASQWMAIASLLAGDAIPLRLFTDRADVLPEPLRRSVGSNGIAAVVGEAERYSLARLEGDAVRVHPLVQEVCRANLSDDERTQAFAAAFLMLSDEVAHAPDVLPFPTIADEAVPHLRAIAAAPEFNAASPDRVANCLYQLGLHAFARGHADRALDLVRRSLQMASTGHVLVYDRVRFELLAGSALCTLWRLDEAEEAFRTARHLAESSADPLGRELADINLGAIYIYRQDADAAVETLTEGLRLQEQRLGPDHYLLLTGLTNLAGAQVMANRPADAEATARHGLALAEKLGEPGHQIVSGLRTNLGAALMRLDRPTEAIAALQSAVTDVEAVEGPTHPSLIPALSELGGALASVGDLSAARAALTRAIDLATAEGGSGSPTRAAVEVELARLELRAGRPKAAAALCAAVIRKMTASMPGHPLIAEAENVAAEARGR